MIIIDSRDAATPEDDKTSVDRGVDGVDFTKFFSTAAQPIPVALIRLPQRTREERSTYLGEHGVSPKAGYGFDVRKIANLERA